MMLLLISMNKFGLEGGEILGRTGCFVHWCVRKGTRPGSPRSARYENNSPIFQSKESDCSANNIIFMYSLPSIPCNYTSQIIY